MSFDSWARYASTPRFRDGRRLYVVTRDLVFVRAGETITVPAGFQTDLASIPAAARAVFSPDGPGVEAAIVHDWLLEHGGRGRDYADAVFLDALTACGVSRWRRRTMHAAVRLRTRSLRWRGSTTEPTIQPTTKPGHRAGLSRFRR